MPCPLSGSIVGYCALTPYRPQAAWTRLAMTLAPQLHPPIPLHVLQALMVLALGWDWWEAALLLLLGFYDLLRPSDYVALTPLYMLASEADGMPPSSSSPLLPCS